MSRRPRSVDFLPTLRVARRLLAAGAVLLAAGGAAAPVASAATVTPTTPSTTTVERSGSLATIANRTGATDLWACGWTGAGVDVALVDTGIAPVPGSGTILNGPDLSFEAQAGAPRSLDGDGHGTHLASIINGRDPGFAIDPAQCRLGPNGDKIAKTTPPSSSGFSGIAPGSRIVNVKVGDADGAVDATQVIAAIDWVVQHRNTGGRNIRVLALAYAGSDPNGDWISDPLSHAVDIARRSGIVVVAAGGNDGSTATELAFPAQNPNIIAVNAADYHGSADPSAWAVADFSSRGSIRRGPDILAPGVSVEGLAVPGSVAADENPTSIVDGRFLKGSGTSQATAVAAGLAALLVQRYPAATPAQVKAMLVDSAKSLSDTARTLQGAGVPVADQLLTARPTSSTKNPANLTTGTGPIEGLRADSTLSLGTVDLRGEIDVQGQTWDAAAWAASAAAGTSWQAGAWRGRSWSASGRKGWAPIVWASSWDPNTPWSSLHIDAPAWTGTRWSGTGWSGTRWSGTRWSGTRWSGTRWSGTNWAGANWAGDAWS